MAMSAVPAGRVVAGDVQQRPEDGGPQHGLRLAHGVLQHDDVAQRVAVGQEQPLQQAGIGERPADDLGQAAPDEHVLGAAPELAGAEPAGQAGAVGRDGGGQGVDAVDTGDLLDEIGLAGDVHAPPVRHGHVQAVVGVGDAEAQGGEDLGAALARHRGAQQAADARVRWMTASAGAAAATSRVPGASLPRPPARS